LGFAALALVLTSCEQFLNEQTISLDAGVYNSSLTIPPGEQSHLYIQKLVEANLQDLLESHGYAGSAIKGVNVTSASVEIAADSRVKNFNAIDQLMAIVQTDILPADTIATYINTLVDATILQLNPLSVDVADYLDANQYSLAIDGTLKEPLTDTLKVNFKIKYEVLVGIPGSSSLQ
jgi:hypothetical protein